MEFPYPENWPQFYTATISGWQHLLKDATYKQAVISSLQFLVKAGKVKVNAFVIMSNHVHIIWQALGGYRLNEIQTSFKKYTSKEFLRLLKEEDKLNEYEVNAADRKHHFWKRNSLGVELFTPAVFYQKLDYIHNNPVNAGLCKFPEEYKYSSALFYETGQDNFNMLEHYAG